MLWGASMLMQGWTECRPHNMLLQGYSWTEHREARLKDVFDLLVWEQKGCVEVRGSIHSGGPAGLMGLY